MLNKLFRFITDSNYRFVVMASEGLLDFLSDEKYLEKMYLAYMGKKLDLSNPRTFNEKINWLKVHDRNPLYTKMVDKYEAKMIVDEILGPGHTIDTLGVWNTVEEVDFDSLPNQFVLKCTHDSGGLSICRDKLSFNREEAIKKLKYSLNRKFYKMFREWAYKDVKPRIIAETYMEDGSGNSLTDYKFFVFNGKAEMLYVSQGMEDHSTAQMSFFDLGGGILPFYRKDYKPFKDNLILPPSFEDMINISEKMAKYIGADFVRIDLYDINGKIYFSEATFYPNGGLIPFYPEEWDLKLGEMLKLTNKDIDINSSGTSN